MTTDILDAICIYTLIIVLYNLNSSMKESREFRKIFSWLLFNKYKSDHVLSFSELAQSAAFSTRASLEWQSSLLLLLHYDALVTIQVSHSFSASERHFDSEKSLPRSQGCDECTSEIRFSKFGSVRKL